MLDQQTRVIWPQPLCMASQAAATSTTGSAEGPMIDGDGGQKDEERVSLKRLS